MMDKETRHTLYVDICEKLLDQYEWKNKAYGNNAHITYCKFGDASYAVRIFDKLNRMKTLMNNRTIDAHDEAILDTIGDGITYCVMCVADKAAQETLKEKFTEESDLNETFVRNYFANIMRTPMVIDSTLAVVGNKRNNPGGMLDTAFETMDMKNGAAKIAAVLLDMYAEEYELQNPDEEEINEEDTGDEDLDW